MTDRPDDEKPKPKRNKPTLFLNGIPIGEASDLTCSLEPPTPAISSLAEWHQCVTLTVQREPTLGERMSATFGDTDPRIAEFHD